MATKQEALRKTLFQFYQNPVAQVSIELFLSVGAVIFFSMFAIRPTILTMSDLLKEIEDKKQLNMRLEQKIAALSTVQSEYLRLQDRLVVVDEALPNTPELVYSLKVIEKLASQHLLAIDAMTVNAIPDESDQSINFDTIKRVDLPITVAVTGDYPAIRAFVESLQQYRRSIIIDTIVFSTSEERGAAKLDANVTLYLPYYTNDAASVAETKNIKAKPSTKTTN